MSYTFDGPNKLVILSLGTVAFSAVDIYSRWKDWVALGNAQYSEAFRAIGGDPIGPGQTVAPYIFLNTLEGWKIRPQEADHELRIAGNLYSLDPAQIMFVPTVGDFAVTTVVERSSAAIAIAIAGGSGLSAEQVTWLRELWLLRGLDPANPLVVSSTARKVPADGSEIDQTVGEAAGVVTVTRI
jgi:hypothetical protein